MVKSPTDYKNLNVYRMICIQELKQKTLLSQIRFTIFPEFPQLIGN